MRKIKTGPFVVLHCNKHYSYENLTIEIIITIVLEGLITLRCILWTAASILRESAIKIWIISILINYNYRWKHIRPRIKPFFRKFHKLQKNLSQPWINIGRQPWVNIGCQPYVNIRLALSANLSLIVVVKLVGTLIVNLESRLAAKLGPILIVNFKTKLGWYFLPTSVWHYLSTLTEH